MEHNVGYYEVDPRASSYYRDTKSYYEPTRNVPRMPDYEPEPDMRRSANVNPRAFSKSAEYYPMGFDGGCDGGCGRDDPPEPIAYAPKRPIVSEIDALAVLAKLSYTQANTETIINMLYFLIILVVIIIMVMTAMIIRKIYKHTGDQ